MAESPNTTCFVIAPIGDAGSETRKRSDQILKHIIAPASRECGYGDAVRADSLAGAGMITTHIIQHLMDDAIVIADLTDHNANVFYELAIRHAFRKPVIQLIQSGQKIPFDVSGLRTVEVDHHDLDSVAQAKLALVQHIKAIQEKPTDVESPVSIAVDREALRSGNSQERELAQVLDAVSELGRRVTDLSGAVERIAVNQVSTILGPWRLGGGWDEFLKRSVVATGQTPLVLLRDVMGVEVPQPGLAKSKKPEGDDKD